jgi:hypothetical protein
MIARTGAKHSSELRFRIDEDSGALRPPAVQLGVAVLLFGEEMPRKLAVQDGLERCTIAPQRVAPITTRTPGSRRLSAWARP